ncbi:MAG: hypothetical protein LH469_01860 [Frankiaceae bacterium]|nr:hypothetical protein [Frankiaceae bacterium]
MPRTVRFCRELDPAEPNRGLHRSGLAKVAQEVRGRVLLRLLGQLEDGRGAAELVHGAGEVRTGGLDAGGLRLLSEPC